MEKTIIIRADGGTTLGMGHIMRCIALAEMLRPDYKIIFATQASERGILELLAQYSDRQILLPASADMQEDAYALAAAGRPGQLIALDGYGFDEHYQRYLIQAGFKLICIDDLKRGHQYAHLIINHAEGVIAADYQAEPYTRFCLGAGYCLLRNVFFEAGKRLTARPIRTVFISMGAADINNLTAKNIGALLRIPDITGIDVMAGAVNPHLHTLRELQDSLPPGLLLLHVGLSQNNLVELIKRADLAICPASTISMECAALGIPILSGFSADNQKGILEGLSRKGLVLNLGDLNTLPSEAITAAVLKLSEDPEAQEKIMKAQASLINSDSGLKIRRAADELFHSQVYFRFAREQDAALYFNWANDPEVRNNSFNQTEIAWQDHITWFKEKLKDSGNFFYLFLDYMHQPAGQVRISRTGAENIIGISIAREFRGRALAREMVNKASEDFFSRFPHEKITAYIKFENMPSYKAFIRAGYEPAGELDMGGASAYRLQKEASMI